MSVVAPQPSPVFLSVKPGDFVVVEADDWWIGQVIHVAGGARNPRHNSIFQLINIDTGEIHSVNADLITRICSKSTEVQQLT